MQLNSEIWSVLKINNLVVNIRELKKYLSMSDETMIAAH